MYISPDDKYLTALIVLVKIDSVLGHSNLDLLTRLRICVYYLYLWVPNTTSVSQKTHKNYRLFKSIYRYNLPKFASYWEQHKKTTYFNISMVGLFVFGGIGYQIGCSYKNASEAASEKGICLDTRKEVGALLWKGDFWINPKSDIK